MSGGGLTEEPATSEQRSVWRLQRSLRAFLPFLDRLRFPDDLWGFRTPGGQDRMIASSRLCWMKTSTHPASTSSSASTSSTAGHRSAESGQGLGVGLRLESITWHTRRWAENPHAGFHHRTRAQMPFSFFRHSQARATTSCLQVEFLEQRRAKSQQADPGEPSAIEKSSCVTWLRAAQTSF